MTNFAESLKASPISASVKRIEDATEKLLDTRGQTHGDYHSSCRTIQTLKDHFRLCPNWSKMDPAQRQSLDMIATKIGRILHGDPNEQDHWVDISGYAKLVG